jgi:GINS complex subunit 4
MDIDDDDFFTKLDRPGPTPNNNAFQDRLRQAPRDEEDAAIPNAPPFMLEEEVDTPLQQLIRHWMNERHAPDILPNEGELLAGLLDHIRSQVGEPHRDFRMKCWTYLIKRPMQSETVQLLRTDPTSSEEEHFRIMLVQTEVERVKFIVRSYLRTRLFKVISSCLLFVG